MLSKKNRKINMTANHKKVDNTLAWVLERVSIVAKIEKEDWNDSKYDRENKMKLIVKNLVWKMLQDLRWQK